MSLLSLLVWLVTMFTLTSAMVLTKDWKKPKPPPPRQLPPPIPAEVVPPPIPTGTVPEMMAELRAQLKEDEKETSCT